MSILSMISTHALVCLFGIGSWIAINGLWVELPILVKELPEGWDLGSYLVVIIQFANIGPLCFTLGNIFFPRVVKEKYTAYLIIIIGIVSCFFLVFFWRHTSIISGTRHSTALLILQFFLAIVDCTSSVVFLPFMSIFKENYLKTYYIGEGLSGLLPSVVALIQGSGDVECVNTTKMYNISIDNSTDGVVGNASQLIPKFLNPHFPVEDFFYFLFAMMLVSGFSFTLLNNMKLCKKEYAPMPQSTSDDSLIRSNLNQSSEISKNGDGDKVGYTQESRRKGSYILDAGGDSGNVAMSRLIFFYLLFLIVVVNALSNGILPSIQSYSCLPYGNNAYHFAVTLGNIANPVACFFAFFVSVTLVSVITSLTLLGLGIAGFIIAMASASPTPILVDSMGGSVLIVCAWVLVSFLFSYVKVNIAMLLRRQGRKALLWCGAVTQVGSAIGAVIMFVFVSILKVFVSAPYC